MLTFQDRYERDKVAAHAKNLAKHVDDEGFPKAGLRMEYPGHLATDFRALEMYGKYLRRTRGEGFKRNMRFCDDTESIYMDIKLPGSDDWLRITPQIAREENRRRNNASDNLVRKQLADSSPKKGLPRQGLLRGRITSHRHTPEQDRNNRDDTSETV